MPGFSQPAKEDPQHSGPYCPASKRKQKKLRKMLVFIKKQDAFWLENMFLN